MNKDDRMMDEQLKQIVQDIHQSVPIPDHTASWRIVQAKLEQRRKRNQWRRRLQLAAGAAAVVICLAVVFQMQTPTTNANMFSLLQNVKQQIVEVFLRNPEPSDPSQAKTPPPPPDDAPAPADNAATTERVTLEEAKQKLAFTLAEPTYMPDGYALDLIRVFREPSGLYRNVHLEYMNDDGKLIRLTQQLVDEHTASIKTEMHIDAGTAKRYALDGMQAVVVVMQEGNSYVDWLTPDNIKLSLSAKLPEEELLRIAMSIPHAKANGR